MKATTLKIVLFFIFSVQLYGQDLLPFVENYSKAHYQGDNQTWNVAQGSDDAMYFANHHYLLRYDGVKWEKNMLPNKTIIRSIFVMDDKIYSGSYKEFGYWTRRDGKMNYKSISEGKSVFDDKENEEIWKIFKFNNNIYFQSFNSIYKYDGTSIKKISLPFLISYCYVIDNEILIASVNKGVYKLVNSGVEKVLGWDALENNVIHAIEKFQNKIYFFTKKNGIFVTENGILSSWKNSLNETLKTANINVAHFLKDNKLAIGTGSRGIYIFDLTKNSYINIERNNVLLNNSILSIGLDNENDLWLGLDNGIAHIEINSPTSIFYDNSGALGSVYSVVKTEEGFLMASNHGVFKYDKNTFSLIPNSEGQAWNITKINNKYIIGHNEGTFIYENNVFSKLNAINGGWNLVKSNINESYIQSSYSGVSIYKNAKDLSQINTVAGILKPIKYVAQNKKNEIWAADNYRGLYRIKYNDIFETTKVENITQNSEQNKNDFGVKIFEFRNEILFLIQGSWYTYNSISSQLVKNELFNKNFINSSDIVKIDEDHFIVLQDGLLYQVDVKGNDFVRNLIQEKYYKGKIINDYLNIFKNGDSYLLNLDDGFISIKLNNSSVINPKIKIEAFYNEQLVNNNAIINYNSELKINIISGIYGANKPSLFYKMNNTPDYFRVNEGLITLNNLESGNYNLAVYNHDGIHYNAVANFKFYIAKPWYISSWMILLYFVVIAIILFVYYRWNKLRYIQKLDLQEEELKHQKKILEIELKSEHELNSQEYEKHILELELRSKASEVTGKSLSIAKQGEMIESIQEILDSDIDFNKLKSEIKKVIKINSVNKHEWETFEANLSQIHDEFIKNLSKKYPTLTSKDIKLCIYLKMNLTSKEIAPLMNISFRGVELHRYRLRKKLQLVQDDNLSKFLLSL